ncbi:MAG: hypothetical protein PHV74_03215 [Dehalococcoidia bacterium]|nr:hypothetical protein [Dehalococcoidia bacterium]
MMKFLKRMQKNQKGITGLETAIILIAFVVVAAVFAYTVLSAGLFASEKSTEAVYSGLKETGSTIKLTGPVMAFQDPDDTDHVGWIKFTLQNALNGEPINFTPPTNAAGLAAAGSANVVVLSYSDSNQRIDDLAWSVIKLGDADADNLLDPGERFEIVCTSLTGGSMFTDVLATDMSAYTKFNIELKPPTGAALVIQRMLPAHIDPVMNLN